MPFAIALSLDQALQTQVRSLWQKLASGDINSSMIETGYPPHVTMAV